MVSRDFADMLIIGPIARYAAQILGNRNPKITVAALSPAEVGDGAIILEEDNLPFARESFDLVISAGTLDSVNDLPGSLIQLRRSLKPDGLLLASLFGAGSLAALKKTMMRADGEHARPHIHPQIDLRSAAGLMNRAGFALPLPIRMTWMCATAIGAGWWAICAIWALATCSLATGIMSAGLLLTGWTKAGPRWPRPIRRSRKSLSFCSSAVGHPRLTSPSLQNAAAAKSH